MKKSTHKFKILKKLSDTGLHLTATDFNASNANQFLIELESQKLITRYKVKREGMSPFKLAYVAEDNEVRAKKYLEALQGVKSKQDEVQESRN